ncbi:MAG: dTDP-glucose 4,6-dehydratase [Thermoplasmata archaeon]|nr:dTDP-glucose 4,6-dehydratase [Thermoplasmata archaeon]
MRVLVTGGAGFIGANLVHHWVREHPSDQVVVLDRLTYAGVHQSILDLEVSQRISFIRGDICDPATVDSVMRERPDLVLHLAAETHVDRSIADSSPFVRTNVLGTQVMLDVSRKRDVSRFHHVSTDEVFGSLPLSPKDTRFDLRSPYDPHSPYAASKAASDHLVRAYFSTYGLPVTISNCGNNYGPYQHPEKFIPNFITRLIDNRRVPLYGTGQNVRDWIFVDDHCRALDLIARQGTLGATYLVGAGVERSNREVTEGLLQLFGRGEESIVHVPDRLGHDLRYAIDPTFLARSLGWLPTVPFLEGLQRTVNWYRDHVDWWRPLLAPVGERPTGPPTEGTADASSASS